MPLNNVKEVLDEIKLDFTDYFKTRGEILQLKAAEKGSPILAKTIYKSILIVLGIIAGSIALWTAVFALSLIFIAGGTDPYITVRGLTFGALCLLGLFLIIILILLAVKKSFISEMELNMINKIIDDQEQKEREAATETEATATPNHQALEEAAPFPEPKDFVQSHESEEGEL